MRIDLVLLSRSYLYGDIMALAKHGNNPNVAAYMRHLPQPYTEEYAEHGCDTKEYEAKAALLLISRRMHWRYWLCHLD